MEFRQGQEPNLYSKQGGRQTQLDQQSNGCRQEPFGHIEKIVFVMPRAFFACLEHGSPILTKSSSRFALIF